MCKSPVKCTNDFVVGWKSVLSSLAYEVIAIDRDFKWCQSKLCEFTSSVRIVIAMSLDEVWLPRHKSRRRQDGFK